MARYFEFKDGKSAKFWEIKTNAQNVTVRYGRIGANGTTKEIEYESASKAKTESQKQINQKTKKGYVEVSISKPKDAEPIPWANDAKEGWTFDFRKRKEYEIRGLIQYPWGSVDSVKKGTKQIHIELSAWRVANGPIVYEEVMVSQSGLEETELDELMREFDDKQIRSFTVVLDKVVKDKDRKSRKLYFNLKSFNPSPIKDEELDDLRRAMRVQATCSDTRFGQLEYCPRKKCWCSEDERDSLETESQPLTFFFDTETDEKSELEPLLKLAARFWKGRMNWKECIEDKIVSLFIDQKNAALEKGKSPYGEKRFKRNLEFHSIWFKKIGADLAYRVRILDGGIFGHRDFFVEGNAKGSQLEIKLVEDEWSEGDWKTSVHSVKDLPKKGFKVQKNVSIWTGKSTTRGATEKELDDAERNLGVKIPASLRKQMKLQNGGFVPESESFYVADGIQPIRYWEKGSSFFGEYAGIDEGGGMEELGVADMDDLVVIAEHSEESICLDYRRAGRKRMPAVTKIFVGFDLTVLFEDVNKWIAYLISIR